MTCPDFNLRRQLKNDFSKHSRLSALMLQTNEIGSLAVDDSLKCCHSFSLRNLRKSMLRERCQWSNTFWRDQACHAASRHCTSIDRSPKATRPPRKRICCRASQNGGGGLENKVSLVLLAGGSGKRMGAAIPKQYLDLAGQPIAMYSLHVFANMPEVFEIVIVCSTEFRDLFESYYELLQRKPKLCFAVPGVERQDSVLNGFQAIDRQHAAVVAIHDSARPLITPEDSRQCMLDAAQVGAAVLGVPVKPTIKEVAEGNRVVRTIQRANLWEVQTPQAIKPELLQKGFDLVAKERLEVTDDVSIIEALGEPVQITRGSYTNIKVTTPEDMLVAEGFLRERQAAIDVAVGAMAT